MSKYPISIVCFFLSFNLFASQNDNEVNSITYNGPITPEVYLQFKSVVEKYPNLKQIVINSFGGDPASGMAIGKLISSKNLILKVDNVCFSACANYIFIAAKNKIISRNAVIFFHGVFQQESFFEAIKSTKIGQQKNEY